MKKMSQKKSKEEEICPTCRGKGKINIGIGRIPGHTHFHSIGTKECPDCKGTGKVQKEKS